MKEAAPEAVLFVKIPPQLHEQVKNLPRHPEGRQKQSRFVRGFEYGLDIARKSDDTPEISDVYPAHRSALKTLRLRISNETALKLKEAGKTIGLSDRQMAIAALHFAITCEHSPAHPSKKD